MYERSSEGYKNAIYDALSVDQQFHEYKVTIPAKNGDLYFTVESYPLGSVPESCLSQEVTYTDSSGKT